jgi:hypothetical protein
VEFGVKWGVYNLGISDKSRFKTDFNSAYGDESYFGKFLVSHTLTHIFSFIYFKETKVVNSINFLLSGLITKQMIGWGLDIFTLSFSQHYLLFLQVDFCKGILFADG